MIKNVQNPCLHVEIQDKECLITGTGNTWHYLLLFAYIVKTAKEGGFTDGFNNKSEEKEFTRILDSVYEYPDDAIASLAEGDYLDGE